MFRSIPVFIIAILFFNSSNSQTAFYKHFEGNIGDNIKIVLDLVATGKDLSGYYYYYFEEMSGSDSLIHYGKSMPVNGTVDSAGIFEFSEFNSDIKGSIFKGKLEEGLLSGTWSDAAGKKQIPFNAAEIYPPGTMPFRVVYLSDHAPLVDKTNSPEASIVLRLLLPADFQPANVADSVTAYIYNDFFDKAVTAGTDPALLLVGSRDLYFRNYKTSNADLYQEGSESFNWKKMQEIRIMHNEQDILSAETYKYGFTGGAHGLSVSKFHAIDLQDGHRITLDEIFRDDYYNDLRDILNSAARRKYKLERNQSLVDAGFFTEFIEPCQNFYLTKDGLGFYYNQYEVAPFALGPIDIFISYKDLKRILSPESPVFRLIPMN
jgi:hypothetical protein